MKKIPTIFERDWDGDRSRVLDKPNPECAWVFQGEGIPTRKLDGTSCMINAAGILWRRRELKEHEATPSNFNTESYDPETKKTVGWVPVGDGPDDRWHREAYALGDLNGDRLPAGTYELVGPKIQGNQEHYTEHRLVPHSVHVLGMIMDRVPRTFEGLKEFFAGRDIEGIVFHHADGRMAKIKKRDFGMKRAA